MLSKKQLNDILIWSIITAVALCLFIFPLSAFAQPANNNCTNASVVPIANGGYGIGVFTSPTADLTLATVQPGETFAPAILVAGQNQKSVWYKFTLPTSRSVRVTLAQPGSLITAGDAGFAVYKTNSCLPAGADISTKLTPIGVFGNTFHPCVENGDYLVQVSSKAAANGPIYITVETSPTAAAYDHQAQAYNFGVLPRGTSSNPLFNIDCQSLEDAGEICNTLGNYQNYNKSTWHVFTTPAYLDYLNIVMAGYPTAAFKFGFKIYQGDVRSTPYSSLPVAWGCDSLVNDGFSYATRVLDCSKLNPNTTYSLQLLYDKNYNSQITLDLVLRGLAPTIAPEPILSAITPTTNNLGVLPSSAAGIVTTANDNLACNARHATHPCEPSLPSAGVIYNGDSYKLSSFFLFTLSATSNLSINTTGDPGNGCDLPKFVRLFKQNVSNSCASLDTANIVGKFITSSSINCLPPGNYTLQVMGLDTNIYSKYCTKASLGSSFTLAINVKTGIANNKFSLSTPGAFDTLNTVGGVMQPMVPGVTYISKPDTLGCANTVLPLDAADVNCVPGKTKAMYREFIVPDSGIVSMWSGGLPGSLYYKLYKGDGNALAVAQSAFTYPSTISGLTSVTLCRDNQQPAPYVCDFEKVCLLPGTYTEAVFGDNNQIGNWNQFKARFDIVNTTHYDLAHAEDLGDIISVIPPAGGSVTSSADYYSCKDNAIVIDGFQPCKGGYGSPGTKAIYRQFYLSRAASIGINSLAVGCDMTPLTLFRGKATDGLAALKVMPAPWKCFTAVSLNVCDVLPAGWYTIVSYGFGPSYQNPLRDLNDVYTSYPQYGSTVGYGNKIQLTLAVSPCAAPKYNRPYKAAIDTVTHQPFLLQWSPRVGHTAAYPKTDTTYTLYTESFNCTNDTPFTTHPVVSCSPSATKVAYWVFKITQESFVAINTENYWNGKPDYAYSAMVYAGNVRNDSALFTTTQPIQPCMASIGYIQLCKLQPGTYTLAVFAPPDAVCRTVTPRIYIDQVGYSRFDHANNAYDFGKIKPDSTWQNGKVGDVNPLNPGRAPSNDFFYCTTGVQSTDPMVGCASMVLPSIYNSGNNNPLFTSNYLTFNNYPSGVARNLWYTFTIDKGGLVKVRVNNKTISREAQYTFYVYKSNADGTLPFGTLVASGGVDSSTAQGLEFVAGNVDNYCDAGSETSFFRETCTPIQERYYIVVANRVPSNRNGGGFGDPASMYPNHQVEVSVLFDSAIAILPKFDHYYQANNMGTNLGPGIFKGATDNYSCATKDATDPMPNGDCTKNLWYKFSTTVSGNIKFRMYNVTGGYWEIGASRFQLFRQIIPGDSTVNGLQHIVGTSLNDGSGANGYYYIDCISPGAYYILLPNCGALGGEEYPEITLTENAGDFCSKPVIASLTGAGSSINSAVVNCHTIGTDYGEFNPTLTCPAGAVTNQYKSTWFKINITGTDTLDVTSFLSTNTNVASSQIKYRLMNGDCGAMQERSCVQDALTQDTYKCLVPGSYWVQVFSPIATTGTIDLHLNAVHHADTCAPINPCLSNANFQMQFDCTIDEAVRFINYSTYGSAVSYLWNFGYNEQTSTAVSPAFEYPSLTTAKKYYITLSITNNSCGGTSTYKDSITIPARPVANLGKDTALCNGGSLTINATSYPGATYKWSTGATTPTILVSTAGQLNYAVMVSYNGCISRDTILVNIDPINPVTQYKYVCGTDPVLLNAARNLGEGHRWNIGATSSSINVFVPGIYWDDIQLNGCTTRDSFIVSKTAASLGNDRQACFKGQPYILNAATQGASGYTWFNGSTNPTLGVTTAGLYWVDISFGNCILRDTIILTNIQTATANSNAVICQGQTYKLPSGISVGTAGIYSDTVRTVQGCDSLITSVMLLVKPVTNINLNTTICQGQTYTLPWGTVVNTTGIYKDTLRYISSGCDSVRRIVSLTVQSAISTNSNAVICFGQTYTLPWGSVVNTTGIYMDTLRYKISGCDSVFRSVNLTVQSVQKTPAINASICLGQSYLLPWGKTVSTSGNYGDTLRYKISGCDSVTRLVNLTVQSPTTTIANEVICSGGSFTLPWGNIVSAPGIYQDTLHFSNSGCDSLYRIIHITSSLPPYNIINVKICQGQSYTLPWGNNVSSSGTYKDTMRYVNSVCDSVYLTVNVTVQLIQTPIVIKAGICAGKSYFLPWGKIVATAGIYRDTIRYASGCDSLIRMVNLTVQPVLSSTLNATICAGQTYTLPWGSIVSTSGIYKDTLRYLSGCDSLYRTVNLTRRSTILSSINATICAGQTYSLVWGPVVNNPGVYSDTIRYAVTGCDSLIRIVNLIVQSPISTNINATICEGQSYTLPWGTIVSTTGVYRDTLRYAPGCDSLRRTVNLTVNGLITLTSNVNVCMGKTYTLPWGIIVNSSGVYRDTIRYSNGCDSLIQIDHVTVQNPLLITTDIDICEGQTYTLPWGVVVAVSGKYTDTLYSINGCDSMWKAINLTVQKPISFATTANICKGQTFTLPWGTTVNTTGIYRDTLHFKTGCDSVRRTVNLTVQIPNSFNSNIVICAGQTYTLPSGSVVSTSGFYKDTLRYISGCDSLLRTVNLTVQNPVLSSINAKICQGQLYTLPWGTVVNTSGIYKDTLHYISGCDSVRRVINLIVQQVSTNTTSATICTGSQYTLPWGSIVNVSGIYRDTLHFTSGCDSLRRTINLTVKPVISASTNATICAGKSYVLPSGKVVNKTGIYKDTLRYSTGCDSLQVSVNLTVTDAAIMNITKSICSNETYTLPWGTVVNTAGFYRDTVRTIGGCDSLIRSVALTVKPEPVINVTKSNDVNCIIATVRLQAFGAAEYTWTPASTLSNAFVNNPIATPTQTTKYYVTATAQNGCIAKDSIEVKLLALDPKTSYLVASSFSPNNDGLNDCFGVNYWGNVTDFNFNIYDRYGKLVFHTTNLFNCWDGMYNGKHQNLGAYIYLITAKGICGPVTRKGTVMLVR